MKNTTLFIDYKKVEHNIKVLQKNKKVCLMVKANNYGAGYEFIKDFVKMGYDYFGVCTIKEAMIVRNYAPKAEILVVAYVDKADYQLAKKNKFTLSVYDETNIDVIKSGCKYHIKFDTGMGRIGMLEEKINVLKEAITKYQNKPLGLYTHFPCGDNEEYTKKQIVRFKKIIDQFSEYDNLEIHLQNTIGSILYDIEFATMVRPGLGIWGYSANQAEADLVKDKIELKPALKLKLAVTMIKEYDNYIGYDHFEHAKGTVVTLRAGYHDGIVRRFQGCEFANGKIVGKICMCQLFVLLNEKKQVEYFEFFGNNESIYDKVAHADMTVYELISVLSDRVKKKVENNE